LERGVEFYLRRRIDAIASTLKLPRPEIYAATVRPVRRPHQERATYICSVGLSPDKGFALTIRREGATPFEAISHALREVGLALLARDRFHRVHRKQAVGDPMGEVVQ
jgi:hypothetical protein